MASILVIEDDSQIRLFLQQALEAQRHMVWTACNGRTGLQIAQLIAPHLVITDVLMPETDGLAVTMALRRDFPDTRIIVLSGGIADMDFLGAAEALGAHRTLSKPLTMGELLDAVTEELHMASRKETCSNRGA